MQIEELSLEVDKLRQHEERFWHQRSRVNWFQAGDANTKFFHQSTLQRRRQNKVLKLKNEHGVWLEHPSRVQELIDTYFVKLFTSASQRD